jgi:hypothetical protein
MSRWQPETIAERFEARYIPEPNSGCWLWTGDVEGGGYGQFMLRKIKTGGKWRKLRVKAHRLSWELHRGEIPADTEVCHTCDMPPCVNPDHLFLGTHQENMQDRNDKGRLAEGERSPFAKITAADVEEIRVAKGTLAAIGERYGISFQTVWEIRKRLIWKSVP